MAEWTDLIGDFMALTEGGLSPEIFKKWSAVGLIAGAMQRRVWAKTGPRNTYANLYTLLVGHPGVGKFVIEEVRRLWTETKEPGTGLGIFKVAPDSMSKASLMDTLARSKDIVVPPIGLPLTTHSLLISAEEFSVLMPTYDLEYIGVLNSIYNNKPLHEESRRTGTVKELKLENPQLNIFAGVQPGWLGSVFPEEAWSTGLASRLIMIYSDESKLTDIFEDQLDTDRLRSEIMRKLYHISQLYGQMKWEPEAANLIRDWHMAGGPPVPGHSKLVHYLRRRTLHVVKLAMISAIAASGQLIIRTSDSRRALAWLLEAERYMPEIFRAMTGKNDAQVLEELQLYMLGIYARNSDEARRKGKAEVEAIHESSLYAFLEHHVIVEKIEGLILQAEKSNRIVRIGGTNTFKPRPMAGPKGVE